LPHKYTYEGVIRRLEEELATCNLSINRIKSISRQDREGFEALREQLRDFMETAKAKKDNSLDLLEFDSKGTPYPPHLQEKISYLCRGQEKMAGTILHIIEKSHEAISFYEQEKQRIEDDMKKYRAYEQRPERND
jgi:hypothetical protein